MFYPNWSKEKAKADKEGGLYGGGKKTKLKSES